MNQKIISNYSHIQVHFLHPQHPPRSTKRPKIKYEIQINSFNSIPSDMQYQQNLYQQYQQNLYQQYQQIDVTYLGIAQSQKKYLA